ncbi:MAG TPA: hypothetical protein VH186_03565 [Chloroflexia bacterium]|nr:hypothetical protein [Chloroflexia bacterium]
MEISPLTAQNRMGEPYQRTPEVTAQIKATLLMSPTNLINNARIIDYRSSQYIKEETLVYLFREYHLAGEEQLVNEIIKILLDRTKKITWLNLPKMNEVELAEIFEDIVDSLFRKILNFEGYSGDYYQVRFQDGVKKLAIDAHRKWSKDKIVKSLSDFLSDDVNEDDADEKLNRLMESGRQATTSVEDQIILKSALEQLPEPYRTVFILKEGYKWPVESLDPKVVTISTVFGKTPKTIRNWLHEAEKILVRWRGETNG